jgi:hypothetical protein
MASSSLVRALRFLDKDKRVQTGFCDETIRRFVSSMLLQSLEGLFRFRSERSALSKTHPLQGLRDLVYRLVQEDRGWFTSKLRDG